MPVIRIRASDCLSATVAHFFLQTPSCIGNVFIFVANCHHCHAWQSNARPAVPNPPPLKLRHCSVPQNSFPLLTGSIFSFAAPGSALGKDYAGAIAAFFCGTLYGFVSVEGNTLIWKIRVSNSLQRHVNTPRDTDSTILPAMQAKSGVV